MIRPNLIGSIPHLTHIHYDDAGLDWETYTALHGPFNAKLINNGEYQPGVYSVAKSVPGGPVTNGTYAAWAFRVPMIPDDTRPGYPFVVDVHHQVHMELDPSKSILNIFPFVAWAKQGTATEDSVRYATSLPYSYHLTDADNFVIDLDGHVTCTLALPPAIENEDGWYAIFGFYIAARAGAAHFWSCETQMQVSVLYQNRPAYDPSMA